MGERSECAGVPSEIVAKWCARDHARALTAEDRAVIDASVAARTLVVERTNVGQGDFFSACAVLGRLIADRGGSPTLAAVTIDGLCEAMDLHVAPWVAPARAAVAEGYAGARVEMAKRAAEAAWEYPRCVAKLSDGSIAIAAGFPDDDTDSIAAWASRVAHDAALAHVRRAVVDGPAAACAAVVDALSLAGIETTSGGSVARPFSKRSTPSRSDNVSAMRALRPLPLALVALAGACSSGAASSGGVSLPTTLIFPRDLLGITHQLVLAVYDAGGGVGCDASKSGATTGVTAATSKVASGGPWAPGSCSGGTGICGSVQVPESSASLVFAATATDTTGTTVGQGCATLVANEASLPLTITLERVVPPSTCGDGVVDATETCDPGSATDALCKMCQTIEEYISQAPSTQPGPTQGTVGQKAAPSFAWPPQSGTGGRFLAVWGDKTPNPTQVAVRVMSDSLEVDSTLGAAAAGAAFWAPTSGGFPPGTEPNNQIAPAATYVGSSFVFAFQDDGPGSQSISLRTMPVGNPTAGDQPVAQPVAVTSNSSSSGIVDTLPAIAGGPGGAALVVWQSGSAVGPGKITARTFTPPSTFGAPVTLSSSSTASRAQVAATSTGWIVTWSDGTNVKAIAVSSSGTASGPEFTVNDGTHHGTQDHPTVAGIDMGRYAIAWEDHGASDGGDIFVQRYGASGAALAGDQASPINDTTNQGEQTQPAMVGSTLAGGMFVVAWLDTASNQIESRILGGSSGFLFNNVDGQDDEFQVSIASHARNNPTVTIGGAGQFIAYGWEDGNASAPGIYARRFPVPTE